LFILEEYCIKKFPYLNLYHVHLKLLPRVKEHNTNGNHIWRKQTIRVETNNKLPITTTVAKCETMLNILEYINNSKFKKQLPKFLKYIEN
jgi:hypothetical protein